MPLALQFLINSLWSGGAEKIASVLANNFPQLKKRRLYLYTILNDWFYSLKEEVIQKSLTDQRFENRLSVLKVLPLAFTKYVKETRQNNPSLLVSFLELSNFITILTAKLLKKPAIVSVHTNVLFTYPINSFYGKTHRILIKKLYPQAQKVIAASQGIKIALTKHFGIQEEKVAIIYNPHDIKQYQKLAEAPLPKGDFSKIFKNSFVFINIGRLSPVKGHYFLIRSFKKVVKKHHEAKLLILGKGELKKKLENLITELSLTNHVFLLGVYDNPFPFLKFSDVFVLSSLGEGLPNVLVEALSLNLPIISTDCPTGPREILCPELKVGEVLNQYPYFGKFGVLSKPFPQETTFQKTRTLSEEDLLAEIMIQMIEDKNLRQRYSEGLKRAKDFDKGKILKEYYQLMEKFL